MLPASHIDPSQPCSCFHVPETSQSCRSPSLVRGSLLTRLRFSCARRRGPLRDEVRHGGGLAAVGQAVGRPGRRLPPGLRRQHHRARCALINALPFLLAFRCLSPWPAAAFPLRLGLPLPFPWSSTAFRCLSCVSIAFPKTEVRSPFPGTPNQHATPGCSACAGALIRSSGGDCREAAGGGRLPGAVRAPALAPAPSAAAALAAAVTHVALPPQSLQAVSIGSAIPRSSSRPNRQRSATTRSALTPAPPRAARGVLLLPGRGDGGDGPDPDAPALGDRPERPGLRPARRLGWAPGHRDGVQVDSMGLIFSSVQHPSSTCVRGEDMVGKARSQRDFPARCLLLSLSVSSSLLSPM